MYRLKSNRGKYSKLPVNEYQVGNFHNPMEVAESFHADWPNVFWVGRNSMIQLTDSRAETEDDIKYQLERIKESRKLMNIYESQLKEKLKNMKGLK